MRAPNYGESMAIFVLFFGVSIIDAIASQNWPRVTFWFVMAIAFALMARRQRPRVPRA